MNDRDERIRSAFDIDDGAPTLDPARSWPGLVRSRTRRIRLRIAARMAAAMVAVLAVGLVVFRGAVPWTGLTDGLLQASRTAGDSIQGTQSEELPVTTTQFVQNSARPDHQDLPSSVNQLLRHRLELRTEISFYEGRIEAIDAALARKPASAEEVALKRELFKIESDLANSQVALRIVDRQLSDHAEVPVVAVPEFVTAIEPRGVMIPGTGADGLLPLYGVGVLVLLAFAMMTLFVRRTARATVRAMSAIQAQVSSQHQTLAAGIDAIALEVERLGESQRYMSRVMVGAGEQGDPAGETARQDR